MRHPNPGTPLRRPSIGTMFLRGLRFRCPWCGGGGLMQSWFKLKPACPTCGLRTERGEEDFFLGAMVWNIAFAEGLLTVVLVSIGIATAPNVPWNALLFGGVAMMIAAPILFYPVSKTLWMATELLFRPLTAEELEWHRTAEHTEFRDQHVR
jgi:uncharacterized protein (DUF983 family)